MANLSKAVVMLSGGITSWAAGMRAAEKYGAENVTLLFADTTIEDEDTYRFLRDGAAIIGAPLIEVRDGRDIWQVFHDVRRVGNAHIAPCSEHLKTRPCRKWLKENADPATTSIVMGLDWTEPHRMEGARKRWPGWVVEFPLGDKPLMTKRETLRWANDLGLKPPALYDQGFQHGNCGGFCVRMGHAQAAQLLRVNRPRFEWHAEKEQEMRDYLGKDVSVLKDRIGGETSTLTLRDFAQRVYTGWSFDDLDWGACGCFLDTDEATDASD